MLRRIPLFSCAFFICISLTALTFADQVTLNNGDRLTGKVVKSDGKTLILHTDAAGDVTIKFDAIQQITAEEDLRVSLKGGKTAVGPITTSDGKLEVATKAAGTVEAAKADLVDMQPESDYEKSAHPGLRHGWNGGTNVGFSVARGNSQTENLAVAFNAAHPTLNDNITLYVSSIYTKNDLASPSTVANLVQGGFRYDHNLSARLFAYGAADFMSNALQFLDLRGVYGGGFGYHVIKSNTTTLNFLGGLNYTHETYSNGPLIAGSSPPAFVSYGRTNRFVALTLGEELMHKLGKSTVLTQNLGFFPDLQDISNYRFTFNLGTVTKISKRLGWQNQFGDIYVSNPPTGAKKNDVIFTTGLNVSFSPPQ